MTSEQYSNAPLNGIELLSSHNECQDAKHKLCEPHAEPVDVILTIGKEVHGLSEISSPAPSFSDRLELFAA